MENDYKDKAGVAHANKLKDLARLTLRFTSPAKLAQTLRLLHTLGFKIVILKVLPAPATSACGLRSLIGGCVALSPLCRCLYGAEQVRQPNAARLLCAFYRTPPR